MPENSAYKALKSNIDMINKHLNGPDFDPHITLVSSFLGREEHLVEKTKTISNKITPFNITFNKIKYLDEFFRSLFITIASDNQFKSARKIALSELGDFKRRKKKNNYIPHMSLVYGDYKQEEKKRMIRSIISIPKGFFVKNIFLAFNDEINLKWKIVKKFELVSSNGQN